MFADQIMDRSNIRDNGVKRVPPRLPPNNLNRVPELVYGSVESAYMDGRVNTNSTFLAHGQSHCGIGSQTSYPMQVQLLPRFSFNNAAVVKLVYTTGLSPVALGHVGSTPTSRTKNVMPCYANIGKAARLKI